MHLLVTFLRTPCSYVLWLQVGISRYEELFLKFRFTEALEVALATQRWEVRTIMVSHVAFLSLRRVGKWALGQSKSDAGSATVGDACVAAHHGVCTAMSRPSASVSAPSVQVVDSVVQALVLHGALEATLAAAPAELVGSVLQQVRRQLGSPGNSKRALALADCLFSSCPPSLASEPQVLERMQQLRSAVADELWTQEQLLQVQGMLAAVRGAV